MDWDFDVKIYDNFFNYALYHYILFMNYSKKVKKINLKFAKSEIEWKYRN
jgi:hypothetical protein